MSDLNRITDSLSISAEQIETVIEWAVVDEGIPNDPDHAMFNRDEAGMYFAESEDDARRVLAIRHGQGATAWIESRTVTYGEWERSRS